MLVAGVGAAGGAHLGGYRSDRRGHFGDHPANQHAAHPSIGLHYLPGPTVRLDLGAVGLTLDNESPFGGRPAGRTVHAGGHAALPFGGAGPSPARRPNRRSVRRFTQLTLVGRYEYEL